LGVPIYCDLVSDAFLFIQLLLFLANIAGNMFFCRVLERSGLSLTDPLPRNDGVTTTVGEALMAPTVIYVKQVSLF
jgi:hypothetical protein